MEIDWVVVFGVLCYDDIISMIFGVNGVDMDKDDYVIIGCFGLMYCFDFGVLLYVSYFEFFMLNLGVFNG